MAMLCRGLHIFSPIQALTETTPLPWLISFRSKFTRARIPQELLDERAQEHEKYGGNPEQPSKLHVVTRNTIDPSFSLSRIQPLKLPHGLPDEEAVADTYLNNKGELIVRHLLKPVEPKAFKS
ncbi:unnamed protein product [Coregonus sp. 'balchen']|nr:unnamed protein product [Coregonus sp. 'balchen']